MTESCTILAMKIYYMFYSVNCQMFFMNVNPNLMLVDQNVHLQTLYESLIQTYSY